MNNVTPVYDPPFFLHKVNNYEKAVYQRKGHWTEKERIKYGVFLEIFRDKFEDRETPILNKMFRIMSDFIKTRNHNQCRSHHQKMERERFQIDSILDSIRSKYHPREYELFFEKYSRHVKAVNSNVVLNEKGFTPHKNVEKRRKIKPPTSQAKLTSLQLEVKYNIEEIKTSKIEKIEHNSEVLKHGINSKKSCKKQIQEKQNQNRSSNEICSNDKEEDAPKLMIHHTNKIVPQQMRDEKDNKTQGKTGLEYENDSDDAEVEEPKIAFVEIPNNLNFSMSQSRPNTGQNINLGVIPEFLNPIATTPVGNQLSLPQFEPYQNFQSQLSPVYRMGPSSFSFEDNFSVSVKDLDDKKKWHLSEASRLCLEMNEHLQQANNCEQMKEMMKQMAEPRRNAYFYLNGYSNNQF